MPPFSRGYLVEGRTPEGFAGALPCAFFELLFGCWLLLPPSALITQSKYTFRTLVFLSDVLPGAWHVDCGFGCHGDLLSAEESVTSSLASFTAPTFQLIGLAF